MNCCLIFVIYLKIKTTVNNIAALNDSTWQKYGPIVDLRGFDVANTNSFAHVNMECKNPWNMREKSLRFRFNTLAEDTFDDMPHLEHLMLELYDPLETSRINLIIPRIKESDWAGLNKLGNLKRLKLCQFHRGIVWLTCDFSKLPHLSHIDLTGFVLRFDQLRHSTALTLLSLKFCYLCDFCKEFVIRMKNLRHLKLRDCYMQTDSIDVLAYLHNLEFLVLDGNFIRKLKSNVFKNLPLLKSLSLSRNKLATIEPDAFKGLKSLIYMDLSFNALTQLDVSLFAENTPKLKTLKIGKRISFRFICINV